MQEEEAPVRTNGFQWPPHPLQVLSWVVFGSDCVLFCIFSLPLLDILVAKVIVGICYACTVLVLISATLKATSCDPADPHVRSQNESEFKGEDTDSMPYCTTCAVPVYARSKHCRACNKCVNVFDHHCMWLNNCIGAANYQAFSVVIASVAIMIAIVLGTCVYLLMEYICDEDGFEERRQNVLLLKDMPKQVFLVLLIALTLVNAPLFVLDLQLVVLHLFLASQDLTTYEYIMNKRNMLSEMEEQNGLEDGNKKAGKSFANRIKTLPSCLDWIVFARCGKRRQKKSKNTIQRIASPLEDRKAADGTPAPPGSTSVLPRGDAGFAGFAAGSAKAPSVAPTTSSAPATCGSSSQQGHQPADNQQRERQQAPRVTVNSVTALQDDQADQKLVGPETVIVDSSPAATESLCVVSNLGCGCDPTVRPALAATGDV